MNEIILHGVLAEEFGERRRMAVTSPAEAYRALCCVVPGFRERTRDLNFALMCKRAGSDTGFLVEPGQERLHTTDGEIHIIPVAAGAEANKVQRGLLVSFFSPLVGGIMVLKGLSEMLTPEVDDPLGDSVILGGDLAPLEQGDVIPIVYGRCRVQGRIMSSSIETVDYNASFGESGTIIVDDISTVTPPEGVTEYDIMPSV